MGNGHGKSHMAFRGLQKVSRGQGGQDSAPEKEVKARESKRAGSKPPGSCRRGREAGAREHLLLRAAGHAKLLNRGQNCLAPGLKTCALQHAKSRSGSPGLACGNPLLPSPTYFTEK